jgi:hypothetical protein
MFCLFFCTLHGLAACDGRRDHASSSFYNSRQLVIGYRSKPGYLFPITDPRDRDSSSKTPNNQWSDVFRRGGEGLHPACCNKCCPTPNAIYLEWLTKWSVECRAHLSARVVRLILRSTHRSRMRASPNQSSSQVHPPPTHIFRPSCSVTTFHLGMPHFDYTRRGTRGSLILQLHPPCICSASRQGHCVRPRPQRDPLWTCMHCNNRSNFVKCLDKITEISSRKFPLSTK